MSKVTVIDSHQISVTGVPIDPDPLSAIVKYAQDPDLSLILLPDLIEAVKVPLRNAASMPASLGLQIGSAFNFGVEKPQLSLSAGVSAAVHVNAKEGADLFSDSLYDSQIVVGKAEGYLSLALTGSVTDNASQTSGGITPGFEAGTSATFEFFRRFPVGDAKPTVGAALGAVISSFVMPADVGDLGGMRMGDVATCSGNGHLKVSGKFTVLFSPVALASPNLPLVGAGIDLNAGASLDVAASVQISSAVQIRSRCVSDGVIELGIYKQKGSNWDLSVTASAGVDATLGTTDLLKELIDRLSKDPAADRKSLATAGLKPDEIAKIDSAIGASIDRSLHASLSVDLIGLESHEAAFLYRIDLNRITETSSHAVSAALGGDLTPIHNAADPGSGITTVRSILTRTEGSGVTMKINFIGLFNFASLANFVSKSQAIDESISGDLIFKETASGDRIDTMTLPQAQTKLRKAIFDSLLITTTYRSCGLLEAMQLEGSGVHFALHSTTNEHTMSDCLDWFVALGLLSAPDKAATMKGFSGTGASTCTARVGLNNAACQAAFTGLAGRARAHEDYVCIGRGVLQMLLMPGDSADADAYRREALNSDRIWNQFDGFTTVGSVMVQEKGWVSNDPRIQVLAADYTTIVWWASAMSSTAAKIVAVKALVAETDPATVKTSKAFLASVADLQKHVMNLVRNSPMNFDQPFGLVALAWAAGNAAVASGSIHSAAFDRQFTPAGQLCTAGGV